MSKEHLTSEKCRHCMYGVLMNIFDTVTHRKMIGCVYIIYEGTRRPCPAGENCKVWRDISERKIAINWWNGSITDDDDGIFGK